MALHTNGRPASRLRRVLAFIAIVWGVAATFVAFEIVQLRAADFVLSYPTIFGGVMLSPTVSESTSCVVPSGRERPQPPATTSEIDARIGPWLLGLSLGRDAVFRQYAPDNRQTLDQLAQGRDELAARLAVPSPAPFAPEQFANANTEFVAFIEQGNPAETARQLAVTQSPRACELFKLGAVWGYSEMVRPFLPGDRAVFATEIRHYAMRTDVPEPLWRPMLQVTASDAKRDDIVASTEAMTDGITKFLASQR